MRTELLNAPFSKPAQQRLSAANLSSAAKGTLFCALASLFALAAGSAYAADKPSENRRVMTDGQQRVWIYTKSDVSAGTSLLLAQTDVPNVIVPLNTDYKVRGENAATLKRPLAEEQDAMNFTRLDLVEDNPIFIGAYQGTEFDTLEALRNRAAMPTNLNVDPMLPVAGAGVKTAF